METRDLGSWEEFRSEVRAIREQYGQWEFAGISGKNRVLFRGMSDATWQLLTTLERATTRDFTVQHYLSRAGHCVPELESLTGKRWNVPDYPELEREILANQSDFHVHLPSYDFLVYLRHHGFPSPLLDWTVSPYVAAYFALYEPTQAERVAVYAYIETTEGSKGWSGTPPMIHVMGPYVSTDSRHFAQKAWYTVATQFDEARGRHTFCPHALVLDASDGTQDVLIKLTIPASERVAALRELADYNIDHFTLFQSEDALVKALALKEFELRDA